MRGICCREQHLFNIQIQDLRLSAQIKMFYCCKMLLKNKLPWTLVVQVFPHGRLDQGGPVDKNDERFTE